MNQIAFNKNRFSDDRSGYTLLELLLALALSIVVVSVIAMAIQIYLVSLTKQQVLIERKQVARAVTTMIGKDLRAAIQYKAADYSGLENILQTQMLLQQPPPETDDAAATEEEEPEDSGIINEDEVSFRPAMIGTDRVIMMDISRLPRLDQYNPMIASAAEQMMSSPSDVKSLAYFFSSQDGGVESQIEYTEARAPGGLYRREVDRAVAEFTQDFGIVSSPDAFSKLIAHEVAEVQFRYFDGETWQTSWDSEEDGGFPSAIEVTVVIDPERSSLSAQEYSYSGFDGELMESFRSVVHLPVAEIIEEEE